MGEYSLPKSEILRQSLEFKKVLFTGKRHLSKFFHCKSKPTIRSYSRLGVVVSKKVGDAVLRNKIKRTTREAFRLNRNKMPKLADLVFLFRKRIDEQDIKDLRRDLESFITNL